MKYLSVCSGIEAASVAWEPLGWEAVGFSEIDPFPRAVLAHRYPNVPLHGDFTDLVSNPPSCDVLVGGTPCQAFSVAGARRSLEDARGNLSLAYVMLADAIDRKNNEEGKQPCIAVWENVPGVFSTKDNAFGHFLGGLSGEDGALEPPGGKWTNAGVVLGPKRAVAWRVLDAQYFGVAQRRRRVFVVASAREGFSPSEVLFEFQGVRRDSAPSRHSGKEAPAPSRDRSAERGNRRDTALSHWDEENHPHPTLNQSFNTGSIGYSNQELFSQRGAGLVKCGFPLPPDVADPLTANEAKTYTQGSRIALRVASESYLGNAEGGAQGVPFLTASNLGKTVNNQTPLIAAFPWPPDVADPLAASAHVPAVAAPTLTASNDPSRPPQSAEITQQVAAAFAARMVVRRLTPRECERLQGFPDDWTLVAWKGKSAELCPDGHRYKALGNSMAVPCMAWIGRRIDAQGRQGAA